VDDREEEEEEEDDEEEEEEPDQTYCGPYLSRAIKPWTWERMKAAHTRVTRKVNNLLHAKRSGNPNWFLTSGLFPEDVFEEMVTLYSMLYMLMDKLSQESPLELTEEKKVV
jgi:hypothetical protein